jgi:hypothetical protein
VAKDKKNKKTKKGKSGGLAVKAGKGLKAMGKSPLVADVVAAALVATVAALRNPKKAQQLAVSAGDELTKLSKAGAKQGSALWEMALQIGRESLEALSSDSPVAAVKAKPKTRKAAARKPAARKSATRKAPVRKTAARKPAARKPAAKRTTARKPASTARKAARKPK